MQSYHNQLSFFNSLMACFWKKPKLYVSFFLGHPVWVDFSFANKKNNNNKKKNESSNLFNWYVHLIMERRSYDTEDHVLLSYHISFHKVLGTLFTILNWVKLFGTVKQILFFILIFWWQDVHCLALWPEWLFYGIDGTATSGALTHCLQHRTTSKIQNGC